MMVRCLGIALALSLTFSFANAQVPGINRVDKSIAPAGRKITISGSNFGSVQADATVFFGAAKGDIQSFSPQLIEVKVPPGATYENITFTNTSTGLSAAAPSPFMLSYGGQHPFSAANLTAQTDMSAESGLYDHCLCDLDADGKTDISTANDNSNFIALFRNTSTVGNFSFIKSQLSMGVRSFHIRCGDLNGDGKPDLVASEGGEGNRLFVFKNNSTPGSFSFTTQSITLAGRKPKQLEIVDLDLDGKPELIVTDQKNGNIIVMLNNSSTGSISFSTPQIIPVAGTSSTDGISVDDVDNDQLPDIIVNQFLSANSNLFVVKNQSTPGNLHLDKITTITLPGTLVNLKVGDLDGDTKPDVAVTQLLGSGISVFLNQSTETEIKFSDAHNFTTDERPWGIDFADLDGDGKAEIAVASITKKSISILGNESTAGNPSFQNSIIATTFINRHVRMGDLDGDGKPDVSFTSIDDNNLGVPASKISLLRNTACIVPSIDPAGPLTVCTGFPLTLFSTESEGATFEWKQDGTSVATGPDAFFNPTVSGEYTVTLTAEGGNCSETSAAVSVNVVAGGAATPPVLTTNSPVCIGSTLNLSATSVGATDFQWRGPEDFTATGANATRTDFQIAHAGRYEVDVLVGTCIAQQGSIIVEAIALPSFRVSFTGSEIVCASDSKALVVSPASTDFTYQWFEKATGALAGETNQTFTTNASGEYYFEAQSTLFPTCNVIESAAAVIKVVTLPIVNFTAPTEACKDKPVTFVNQSTTDSQATAVFSWDFGDASFSADESPSHAYTTAQEFNVKLKVAYSGNTCPVTVSKTVKISVPPSISITSENNDFDLCEGETKVLGVSGIFESYTWNTTETTSSITVDEAGTYSVSIKTTTGCEASASKEIRQLAAPEVVVTATPATISLGQESKLEASGLTTFMWHPGKKLVDADSTSASPSAKPSQTTTYTVEGTGANGCAGTGSVTIEVKQENIGDLLKPSNFFSPNSDATNNFWAIENITTFPQCTVSIFDEKGIKVFEVTGYQNDWDGTHNGKALPNGVYFYFIRCEGDQGKPKTGSITLLR